MVRFLARYAGIARFLDIGAGLPAADNTHQIASREAPRSRVLYVDHDPMVVERSQAMLAGSPPASCGAIPYRLRTPAQVAAFFDGLELVGPGLVPCERWRPEPGQFTPSGQYAYGGTGRRSS